MFKRVLLALSLGASIFGLTSVASAQSKSSVSETAHRAGKIVTVGGFPVSVPAGFKGPIVQVPPPAGSTPVTNLAGKIIGYNLPPGAIGEHIRIERGAASEGTSIRVTALYPQLPPVPNADLPTPPDAQELSSGIISGATNVEAGTAVKRSGTDVVDCDLVAGTAKSTGGSAVQTTGYLGCTDQDGEINYQNVIATLYWWSGSSWTWQSNNSASKDGEGLFWVDDFHGCRTGETHDWHSRADGTFEAQGVLYSVGHVNSKSVPVTCKA